MQEGKVSSSSFIFSFLLISFFRRISKLKDEFRQKISEFGKSSTPYDALPMGDDEDNDAMGIELGTEV